LRKKIDETVQKIESAENDQKEKGVEKKYFATVRIQGEARREKI